MEIPKLKDRLEQTLFVVKFDRVYSEIAPDVEALNNASLALKNSEKFKEILSLILSIGNYINGRNY